jgi:hypothetical protein
LLRYSLTLRILPDYITLLLHSHHYENIKLSGMVNRSLLHCIGGVHLFLFLLLMKIHSTIKQWLILLIYLIFIYDLCIMSYEWWTNCKELSPSCESASYADAQELTNFYETRRIITMFTLSWTRSIQTIPPKPISVRSILTGSLWRHQSQQSFNTLTPFNFFFFTHYMFRPLRAILRWDIQLVIIFVFDYMDVICCHRFLNL